MERELFQRLCDDDPVIALDMQVSSSVAFSLAEPSSASGAGWRGLLDGAGMQTTPVANR